MFDATLPLCTQEVESEAILGGIRFGEEPRTKANPLCRIDKALKN